MVIEREGLHHGVNVGLRQRGSRPLEAGLVGGGWSALPLPEDRAQDVVTAIDMVDSTTLVKPADSDTGAVFHQHLAKLLRRFGKPVFHAVQGVLLFNLAGADCGTRTVDSVDHT